MSDPVNHPEHYCQGRIECIEALESALPPDEFRGWLRGQIFKYLWRLGRKDAAAVDARKAAWYLDRLIAEVEGADDRNVTRDA